MGGWLSYSVVKIDAQTQTEREARSTGRPSRNRNNDIGSFTEEEIAEMIMLYREKQEAIDRSSIRGVQRTKNHYDAISKSLRKQMDAQPQHFPRPNFDPDTLHRRMAPGCSTCELGYTWVNDRFGKKVFVPWPQGLPTDLNDAPATITHESDHPKGYLTRITQDYLAKSDEEMTVQKGIMVKVLRNHRDGRYEVYYSGAFGLVPGKVLSYVQYEPEP